MVVFYVEVSEDYGEYLEISQLRKVCFFGVTSTCGVVHSKIWLIVDRSGDSVSLFGGDVYCGQSGHCIDPSKRVLGLL